MTLAPLLAATPAIQIHAFSALAAILLAAPQFLLRKGDRRHRALGYAWTAAMFMTAGTSFFIHTKHQFGPFSWIHLLSILTLVTVPVAVLRARQGRVREHGIRMSTFVALALVVTGLFTLLPGRIMHAVVFGPASPSIGQQDIKSLADQQK